jgi:hypothetical protein
MLDAHIIGYDVKNVIFDLGFDVKILPNKSWEIVRNPILTYFLI